MNDKELEGLLGALAQQVDALNADEATKASMQALTKNIRQHIDESDLNAKENERARASLVDSLREQLQKIEAEHPSITGIANDIMMKLSNMGI